MPGAKALAFGRRAIVWKGVGSILNKIYYQWRYPFTGKSGYIVPCVLSLFIFKLVCHISARQLLPRMLVLTLNRVSYFTDRFFKKYITFGCLFHIFHNSLSSFLLLLFTHRGKQGQIFWSSYFIFPQLPLMHPPQVSMKIFLWECPPSGLVLWLIFCCWGFKLLSLSGLWMNLWYDIAGGLKLLILFTERPPLGITRRKDRCHAYFCIVFFTQVLCF